MPVCVLVGRTMMWCKKRGRGHFVFRRCKHFFLLFTEACIRDAFRVSLSFHVMATESEEAKANDVIVVPEYFYAVDINYLTHMIGNGPHLT